MGWAVARRVSASRPERDRATTLMGLVTVSTAGLENYVKSKVLYFIPDFALNIANHEQ